MSQVASSAFILVVLCLACLATAKNPENLEQLLSNSNSEHQTVQGEWNAGFFEGVYTTDETGRCVHPNPFSDNCHCVGGSTESPSMMFVANNTLHFFTQCFTPRATDFGQYGGAFQCNSAAKDGSSCDECVVRNPGTNGCSCPANTGFVARKVVVPMVKKDSNHVVSTINFCVAPNGGTPAPNKPTPVVGVCLGSDDPDCYCNDRNHGYHTLPVLEVETTNETTLVVSLCAANCTAQSGDSCGGYCALCEDTCYNTAKEQCCQTQDLSTFMRC